MKSYESLKFLGEQHVLVFENEILRDLWVEELIGQISDGMWENTTNSCWAFWYNIKVELGEKNEFLNEYGYDFVGDRNIKANFGFARLIPYVGDRMIEIGLKYDSDYNEKKLRQDLKKISNLIKSKCSKLKVA